MLYPKASSLPSPDSQLPQAGVRWDMLALGLFTLICGYALLLRPERSVEMMFSSDKSKLEDETTRKLWKLYVQYSASFFFLWSLLPLGEFIKSFR